MSVWAVFAALLVGLIVGTFATVEGVERAEVRVVQAGVFVHKGAAYRLTKID